jgi:hypothetical protein
VVSAVDSPACKAVTAGGFAEGFSAESPPAGGPRRRHRWHSSPTLRYQPQALHRLIPTSPVVVGPAGVGGPRAVHRTQNALTFRNHPHSGHCSVPSGKAGLTTDELVILLTLTGDKRWFRKSSGRGGEVDTSRPVPTVG